MIPGLSKGVDLLAKEYEKPRETKDNVKIIPEKSSRKPEKKTSLEET